MLNRDSIKEANIVVHTRMIEDYESEPHWRPENILKVNQRLSSILPEQRLKALDVGAGTGFLTRLLTPHFQEVSAIDITEAMLNKIPKSQNLRIFVGEAEKLPFPDNEFDFVCAYSFLHHLFEPSIVMKEMVRVLKPGGVIYVDLEPNFDYWSLLKSIDASKEIDLSPIVKREIGATVYVEEQVEAKYQIPKEIFAAAEYSKSMTGGFERKSLHKSLLNLGLEDLEVNLDWYMGQGIVMHEKNHSLAQEIEEHLRAILPASSNLFKYIWFTGTKGIV